MFIAKSDLATLNDKEGGEEHGYYEGVREPQRL